MRKKGRERMGEIEQLVRRAKKRDPDAFTELMQLHEKDMYRTASAILAQDADIADAIQETILTCWEKSILYRKTGILRHGWSAS